MANHQVVPLRVLERIPMLGSFHKDRVELGAVLFGSSIDFHMDQLEFGAVLFGSSVVLFETLEVLPDVIFDLKLPSLVAFEISCSS